MAGFRSRRDRLLPGDGGQFDATYQRHYAFVYAYARRRVPDSATAEDVVSEVFLTAWRQRRDLPAEPQTRLWLTRVAFYAVSNTHRGARRASLLGLRLAQERPDPEPVLWEDPRQARFEQVRAALEQLPASDRELLRLAMWEQLTLVEIAQVLEISANAAGVRLHRARQRLRRLLQPDVGLRADPPPPQLDPLTGRRP